MKNNLHLYVTLFSELYKLSSNTVNADINSSCIIYEFKQLFVHFLPYYWRRLWVSVKVVTFLTRNVELLYTRLTMISFVNSKAIAAIIFSFSSSERGTNL